MMVLNACPRAVVRIVGLLCVPGVFAAPARAASPPQARLVHCGAEACLRLSGQRSSVAVTIGIGGRELAVAGGRNWRAIVPLQLARTWPISRGYALRIVFADAATGTEHAEPAMLPPGALGSGVELASLVVHAR